MSTLDKLFVDGNRFLLRIDEGVAITTSAGTSKARVKGELQLELRGQHPTRLGVAAARLALSGSSVRGKGGDTGRFTVIGERGEGVLKLEGERAQVELQVACRLNYPSLDAARAKNIDLGCYYTPVFEPASTRITAKLVVGPKGPVLEDVRIAFVCAAGDFDQIREFVIVRPQLQLTRILPARDSVAGRAHVLTANHDTACDTSLEVNHRRLSVQPVRFISTASDPSPSGSSSAAQFATAQTVWAKACIQLDVRSFVTIESATLKTSSDLTAIRASHTDADPDVIEVYFVDNLLPATGGGNAGAIGMASCKVVIAEPNAGNPVLLAHELGHVLGLLHPPGSDSGSVMQPTGSASNPGTEIVSHFMCESVATPVLETLTTSCCLGHDVGDHYIRDFPVDVGDEPSVPLPAGMTRYSMSNVFNRRSNTAGGWNASTGPDHEQPSRFEADGVTPKINWMHARVEQLETLEVRDAKVAFYLKQPGSGGGGAGLSFLGEVDVPPALAVGSEQIVRVPWLVPSGLPNHSCAFGVVHSPAEPLGNPSGLSWSEFEAVALEHNDWAQRNLDIVQVDPGNSNSESGNIAAAPFVIDIPPEESYRPLPLWLEVDASAARGLEALVIEIPGHEQLKVTPGERMRVEPKTLITPGQPLVCVVRGVIPKAAPRGARYAVAVDPVVARRPLAGFAVELRLGSAGPAIAQILDVMMAAFTDLAAALELPFAHGLQRAGARAMQDAPRTARELAELACLLLPKLEEGLAEVATQPGATLYDLRTTLSELSKQCARFRDGGVAPQRVVEAFRDLMQRLSMVACHWLAHPPSFDASRVRVILDRLEILNDHDPIGPGECYFTSEIRDASGRCERRRFPEHGYFRVDADCKRASIQLRELLYDGAPGGKLELTLEGRELDLLRDDRFTRYRRTFTGSAASFVGTYIPEGPDSSPQAMSDWRVFYRIV